MPITKFRLGKKAKLYRSADPLTAEAGPEDLTWIEVPNVRDLTLNMEKAEADVTTREDDWETAAATLKSASLEFDMIWRPGDPGFEAIKDSFFNDTEVALMALDGPVETAGNQGLAANMNVFNFSKSEPLREAQSVSVSIKPSSYPEWHVVGES